MRVGSRDVLRKASLTLGFAGLLVLPGPARAQDQQQFFNESKPLFENCGDPSYGNAVKSGITLGFSQNPPEAWLDEQSKQPTG
ncbi:MAG: hypothetical protein JO326_12095, partial [Acetobacteraceae bacterium]|nr:hypothetical protein [Acetobacteraceae bacterium]